MNLQTVWISAFSPAGATEKVVRAIGEDLAKELDLPLRERPFTKPGDRAQEACFGPSDLAVIGSPTYAGRMPNKIAPDFQARFRGDGALAVPVVTYGNRAWENSLAELCALLGENGFQITGAGAVPIGTIWRRLGPSPGKLRRKSAGGTAPSLPFPGIPAPLTMSPRMPAASQPSF